MISYFLIGWIIYSCSLCECMPTSSCDNAVPQVRRHPPRSFLIKREGDTLELQCFISGCPTSQLHWLYKSKPIKNSNNARVVLFNNSTSLKINDLNNKDGGSYTCVAVNTAGRSQKSFWIVVQPKKPEKAEVLQPPKDKLADKGETVQLSCIIAYYPQAPFAQAWAWFKDGKRADENQRREWSEKKLDGSKKKIFITLSSVQGEDRGEYGCCVLFGNFRGNSAMASATLTISP